MANPNISASLTAAQKTTLKNHLTAVSGLLNFMVNLTAKQRRTLFKMGPKSVSYVQLALQIGKNNPAILPSNFDVNEFEKDVKLTMDLSDIETILMPLAEGLSDTLMATGTEAMQKSNQVYDLVKVSAKTDSNMKVLAKQLGERYKKTGKGGKGVSAK